MAGPSMAEVVRYLTDFVQGVSLTELKGGADSKADGELFGSIGGLRAHEKLLQTLHAYIKSHVKGKKRLSKQAAGTLALALSAIAKFEFYAKEKKVDFIEGLTDLAIYRQMKNLAFECESDRIHGPREFLDHMEVVKGDLYYELFYIRKSDGSRFFSPRLGSELHDSIDLDLLEEGDSSLAPVLSFKEMYDSDVQHLCEVALERCKESINAFLRGDFAGGRLAHIALALRKSIMAAVLCARKKNTLLNVPVKSSSYYFKDVLFFLRKVVSDSLFLEICKEPNGELERSVVSLANALCHAFVMRQAADHSSFSIITDLLERGALKAGEVDQSLVGEYSAFNVELSRYLHGPLILAWDFLGEVDEEQIFDPWIYGYLPSCLGKWTTPEHETAFLRMPSPTMQSHVGRAVVGGEFIGFLRGDPYQSHLLINFQGKEQEGAAARTEALEALVKEKSFKGQLHLAHLPKECAMYNIEAGFASPTGRYSKASSLIEAAAMACRLSESLSSRVGSDIALEAFHLAHKHFTSGKKGLEIEERRALLDGGYLLLILRLIRELSPSSVSIACKDGVDKTGVHCALMASLMHHLQAGPSAHKLHILQRRLIFEVPMIIRERAMASSDFERLALLDGRIAALSEKGKKEIKAYIGELGLRV